MGIHINYSGIVVDQECVTFYAVIAIFGASSFIKTGFDMGFFVR